MLVEDCSNEDDFDEDKVDYFASRGSSKFFRSLMPPSTDKQLDVALAGVLRVSSLYGSGKLALLAATLIKNGSSSTISLMLVL